MVEIHLIYLKFLNQSTVSQEFEDGATLTRASD